MSTFKSCIYKSHKFIAFGKMDLNTTCLFQICEDCHADMFPEVRDFVNQDLPLLYPLKVYNRAMYTYVQFCTTFIFSMNELSITFKKFIS